MGKRRQLYIHQNTEPTTGMPRLLLEEDKEWEARQSADCDFRT